MKNNFPYYSPVLLYQGMKSIQNPTQPFVISPVIGISNFDFETAKGRGVVKGLDILPLNIDFDATGSTVDSSVEYTLTANGIQLIDSAPVSNFAINRVSTKDWQDAIRVLLNQNGTLRLTVDSPVANTPAIVNTQLAALYTNDAHEEWLKKANLCGSGLGQKQQTFLLQMPNTAPSDVPVSVEFDLPSNKGDIVGFSITHRNFNSATADQTARYFSVAENGIKIVEDLPIELTQPRTSRKYWMWYKLIEPSSRIAFSVLPTTAPANDEFFYITFYFGN